MHDYDSVKNIQDEEINVAFDSSKGRVKLVRSKLSKFQDVSSQICEVLNWDQSETRFLLDGVRVQNDLTLYENNICNNAIIEVFKELKGGKGPSEDEILQMLEDFDTDSDDTDETDHNPHPHSCDSDDYKWYEELRFQLKNGMLKLDRSNHLHEKLMFLLQKDHLEPYEMLRLKNVHSCWEQHNIWKKDGNNSGEREIETTSNLDKTLTSNEATSKRSVIEVHQETYPPEDEGTPSKRRKLMETMGLNTPSPMIKMSNISEMDMKRISVSVHLWAERKMGGVQFLQTTRLNDSHFEDILKFTGPGSKWNTMKGRTIKQFRSLWRNNFGGKKFYRGQKKTGFENEFGLHVPFDLVCPFGHCSSGLMSPMDMDLIVLTPKRTSSVSFAMKSTTSSRKLFDDVNQVDVSQENDDINVTYIDSTDAAEHLKVNEIQHSLVSAKEVETSEGQEPNFVCKIDGCGKGFQTFFGFERHNAANHTETKLDKTESICPICEKKVIYLDQHMRGKHSDLQKPVICEICLKEVNSNVSKHRKICIKCRYCDYQNIRKARLLSHIENCTKSTIYPIVEAKDQLEAMDLRSPVKLIPEEGEACQNEKLEIKLLRKEMLAKEQLMEVEKDADVSKSRGKEEIVDAENEALEIARTKYPIDEDSTEEDYYSEIEIDDDKLYTIERRKNKDNIEKELRAVDALENVEIKGDSIIVEKFSEFMRNKRYKSNKDEGYSKQTEPTTINMYSDVVRKDILKAFHKLVTPFDARWLIDCSSTKECRFEGEERKHVTPEEPIYMTSRILEEALENTSTQKRRVICAFRQLMDFIELHFTLKLNAFGVEVLDRVIAYHTGVKTFIKATSQWKNSKEEEKEEYENNKLIKDYQNPNNDLEVLEKYKNYVKSEDRINRIAKLLSYSHPKAKKPSAADMTEFGIIVMEEIVGCTGCRPKVVRHLKMGACVDAKPGFNPHDVKGEDATLEEVIDGVEIWRRVNPNLPPKGKACIHQTQSKSALCSENCENQCVPEGYNYWITWDKTQSTKGPYFLHIPTPVKKLMDRYDIVRTNFFKDKKPKFDVEVSWLEDYDTPFFLNSACNSFPSLDLKKLSSVLGIDITAYSFRKIVSTWALSHKLKEIRQAEEEALQHSLWVAKDRYMQNKQVQPQTLVQTYAQEENLFPEKFRNELQKDKCEMDKIIAEKQENRSKMRHLKMFKQKEMSKKLKFAKRPLGPRTKILESDRTDFADIIEELTGSKIKHLLTSLKPIQWRNLVIRLVCSSTGETGDKLRDLWKKIYRGDLQFGIRDERLRAKENNWPVKKQNPGRKDRNSWVAHALRMSCLAAQKFDDMDS